MVSKMIPLHLTHVRRKYGMMQSMEELKNKEQGIRCVLTHSAYSRKERLQAVGQTEKSKLRSHLQNAKEPEMMPFAMGVGNILYASWVNGACRVPNKIGGITSLKLLRISAPIIKQDCNQFTDPLAYNGVCRVIRSAESRKQVYQGGGRQYGRENGAFHIPVRSRPGFQGRSTAKFSRTHPMSMKTCD